MAIFGKRKPTESELEQALFASVVAIKQNEKRLTRPMSIGEIEGIVRTIFKRNKQKPAPDMMQMIVASAGILDTESFAMDAVEWIEQHPNEPVPWLTWRPAMLAALKKHMDQVAKLHGGA